ncbi:MAG: class I SAM-dependent methyltransferase [Fimbriimonadales bacterium]
MTFFFEDYIRPYLLRYPSLRILEIGASHGEHTDLLRTLPNAQLTLIDPCLDEPLDRKYAGDPRVTVVQEISLNALPRLSAEFDCILIDGDHNWWTVISELRLIEERCLLAKGGVVFLHDVGWPYGRRDMCYRPETIPPEQILPYAQKGIEQGRTELTADPAVNSEHYNVITEDGPRNGVLTAIEDFASEEKNAFRFFGIYDEFGLGVMIKKRDRSAVEPFNVLVRKRNRVIRDRNWKRRMASTKAFFLKRVPWLYVPLKKVAVLFRPH